MSEERGVGSRFRELGSSVLALVQAELAALLDDLARSGRGLLRALVLLGLVAAIGFWSIGLLIFFAIELLALALPRWGAVGSALALTLLATAISIAVAKRRLAKIEPPAATVKRRFEESRRWWQEKVAADPVPPRSDAEPEERAE